MRNLSTSKYDEANGIEIKYIKCKEYYHKIQRILSLIYKFTTSI
jgi:hypothetical protein